MGGLLTGLWLGVAAGISPGPMLALVIRTSLRHGLRHGVTVACAPLLSDAVVVAVTLLALREVPERWVAVLGVVGGLLVTALGVVSVRDARSADLSLDAAGEVPPARRALREAVLVNIVSPHPWVAWIAVLGPLVVTAWRDSPLRGALFVVGFYVAIVGSKAAIATLVAGSRHRLSQQGFRRALLGSALLLLAAGLFMVVEFGSQLLA
ncbi:LysE family translocator [Actinomycetota bacterium]